MTYLFGETCTSNASRRRFFQIGVVFLKNHDLAARFFPTLTIVTACRGQDKSDLADISTCHAGIPQFLPRTKKDCGRRDCHGDSLSEEKNAKVVMQADSKRSCGVLAFHNILSLARGGESIL